MNVSSCMSTDVRLAAPDDTIQQAAKTMKEIDSGVLPVADNDRLVGMITDRDIAIRGVGAGKSCNAKVSEVMSSEVLYVFDDQDISEVSQQMADLQVRRMPVVNRDKRLVGIISLGDLAQKDQRESAEALRGVSEHGGLHNQAGA